MSVFSYCKVTSDKMSVFSLLQSDKWQNENVSLFFTAKWQVTKCQYFLYCKVTSDKMSVFSLLQSDKWQNVFSGLYSVCIHIWYIYIEIYICYTHYITVFVCSINSCAVFFCETLSLLPTNLPPSHLQPLTKWVEVWLQLAVDEEGHW